MIPLGEDALNNMWELSKFDDVNFVGSEIRQLIGTIRYWKGLYKELDEDVNGGY